MKKKDAKKDKELNNEDQIQEVNDLDSPEKGKEGYSQVWDKFVRLQAEFDNYRKRSFKERAEFIKYANEGLILELLGILDNFERGIKAAEQKKDFDLLHQGVDMISKQLHTLLESKGLNRIKSLGMQFDPHQHEALEVIEDASVEDETIVDELQPGYTFNGRIIRPAKVKVKRAKSDNQDDGDKSEIKDNNNKEE